MEEACFFGASDKTYCSASWIKRDQLDVICFIISLFTAQHVSDVLTSETCWAVNDEIIKQMTSSWSLFIQLSNDARSNKHKIIVLHSIEIWRRIVWETYYIEPSAYWNSFCVISAVIQLTLYRCIYVIGYTVRPPHTQTNGPHKGLLAVRLGKCRNLLKVRVELVQGFHWHDRSQTLP